MKCILTVLLLLWSGAVWAQQSAIEKMYDEGFSYYRKGEKLKAIEVFEKIYALDSTETDALDYKTIIYHQTGQYAKAAAGCAKLCRLFPEKDDVFASASFNYMLIKQAKTAEAYAKKAVQLNGYRYNNMLNLAHACLLQYKTDQAIYWYAKAMQWVPNKAAFEQSFMGDLKMMDSLKLMPADIMHMLISSLQNEFSMIDMQSNASIYLDSIVSYIGKKTTIDEDEKILQWKKDFIKAETDAPVRVRRMQVGAVFLKDIGISEYNKRNRAVAMDLYFKKAEDIFINLHDSLSQATLLNAVALELLIRQNMENKLGKNKDGLIYALKGREVIDANQLDELNALSFHILAECYFQQDENETAENMLFQLLDWSQKTNDGKGYFWANNGLSTYNVRKNRIDSALYYHNACMQKIDDAGLAPAQINVVKLNGLNLLYSAGQYNKAIRQSNNLHAWSKQFPDSYSALCELLGDCYTALLQTDSAYKYYKVAVETHINYSKKQENIQGATLPVQVNEERTASLWALCNISANRNDAKNLFYWTEMMKDNMLRHLISQQYQPTYLTPLEKAKKGLEHDAAAITFIGTTLFHNRQSEAMAFDNNTTLVELVKPENTLKAINNAGVSNTFSRLLSLTQKKPGITSDSIDASVSLPLMQYYFLTNNNPTEVRSYIAKKRSIDSANATLTAEKMQLSKLLFTLYIKPFESIIKGKKTLYISADNVQHYFPFETLMMDDGRYLAEAYDIIYTPSFTIHEYLQKRSYNSGSSIIAAGNPDYSTYHPELHEGRALDLSYYGVTSWTDLPGTEQEIKVLQQQFDSITVYTGKDLSETNLKQLSEAGKLSGASALHFALHGLGTKTGANEDNALVLTEPDKGKEDGLLLFYEAYNLDIKPQMVCLSACETGLGMIAQDGSLATMGTAFLAAGAKAVLVTNWSIDDAATALFMKYVYQQVRTAGTGYAAAVANTKRKFIKGDFGQKYKDPYYWAPFKYYGN